jgi:hypothetical protein
VVVDDVDLMLFMGSHDMKRLHFLLAGLALASPSILLAKPVVTLKTGPTEINRMQLCEFAEDSMTLLVSDHGRVVAKDYFCASSGNTTTVRLVTDIAGNNYIVLNYGTGHGSQAMERYLMIYALPKDLKKVSTGLYEYLRTPIFAAAGLGSSWEYTYKIYKPRCGGLRLALTRIILEGGNGKIFTMPAEKTRVIEIGVPPECSR